MAASIALITVRLLLDRNVMARIVGVFKVHGLTIAFSALCTPTGETIAAAKAVDVIAAMVQLVSRGCFQSDFFDFKNG